MVINVEKDESLEEDAKKQKDAQEKDEQNIDLDQFQAGNKRSKYQRADDKANKKEWGRILLAEDVYIDSDSDEVAGVKQKIMRLK